MVAESIQDRKLFIGGLSPITDDSILKDYFSKWGEILDLVVMKDNATGRSRGFAFVTYALSSQAEEAVAAGPHTLDGKLVDTKRAVSRDDIEEGSGPVTKVFVGGLNSDITNIHLSDYFEKYGTIKEAVVMTDKETGESRCFAFVTFDDCKSVERVMNSKPHNIKGAQLDVKKAISKDEMRRKNPRRYQSNSRSSFRNGHRSNPSGSYYQSSHGYDYWSGNPGYGYMDMESYGYYPKDYDYGSYPEQSYQMGPDRSRSRNPYNHSKSNRMPPYGRT